MQSALQKNFDVTPEAIEDSRLSDEELMACLQDNDFKALEMLFNRYSRLVFSIALRILHDTGEAEDVVQEAFLYIYQKAMLFESSKGSAKVWIVQIAYSRARDRKAHLSRRGFYLRSDIESLGLDDTLAGHVDMERDIRMRLDFSRLQGAFKDLSQIQRDTLELFYFEGLDLREISEKLHEPLSNVRHHFYRGLERLRKSSVIERLRRNQHV